MRDLTPREFARAWQDMLDKLTPAEREMLETALVGAEVNYTLVYILFAFLIGTGFGWIVFVMVQ